MRIKIRIICLLILFSVTFTVAFPGSSEADMIIRKFSSAGGVTTCTGTVGETGIENSVSNPGTYGFFGMTRFPLGCSGTPNTMTIRVNGGYTYEFAIYTGVQGGTLTRLWQSGDVAVTGSGLVDHNETYTGSEIPESTDIWLACSVPAPGDAGFARLAHGTATGDETLEYTNDSSAKPAFPETIPDGTLDTYDSIRVVSITFP